MQVDLKKIIMGLFVVLLVKLSVEMGQSYAQVASATGQALAFPGAEGFGKFTTGGRGGNVFVVTNLNDDGPGSLREAIRKKGPRIIVFAVSGTIDLKSSLNINSGDLTIAGQSAPGDGICIRNFPLKIKGDNIIVRYIKSRMGDQDSQQDDAVSAIGNKNIIIDHCSFSWGTDEAASFYDNENFTLQWTIVSESLNASVHKKGEHGYGGIWGGKKASFHHNLLAHHKSRNPRFNGARYHKQPQEEIVDFRNNIIYNWKSNSSYGGEEGNHNVVNNYYKPGPATSGSKKSRILDPWSPFGSFYVSGNVLDGNKEVTENNRKGVEGNHPDSTLVNNPVQVVAIPEQAAEDAFKEILAHAGSSFKRDDVDKRIVQEVKTGAATFGKEKKGIIDSQEDVGGWPELKSIPAPSDKDQDGMADDWEVTHQLNPEDSKDASQFSISNEYSNIEVYLNNLLEEKGL